MNRAKESLRDIKTPIQFLKGVGSQRAQTLAKLKLHTASDLLFFFPRRYEDLSEMRAIGDLEAGEAARIIGQVEECELRELDGKRSIFGLLLRDDGDFLRCTWFNQPFLKSKYRQGQTVMVTGSPKRTAGRWEMVHPEIRILGEEEDPPEGFVLPIYSLTEGVQQGRMRRIVRHAVEEYAGLLPEAFPDDYLATHDLMSITDAIRGVHMPEDVAMLEAAQRRLVFQELLLLQLALAVHRRQIQESPAPQLIVTPRIDSRIRRRFAFALTEDQNAAVEEIVADLAKPQAMNRLLQGEVGSGKTVVAEYAMLAAVALGHQAVLMAPTDVLARQHLKTLNRDLAESHVRVEMLTGSLTPAQRRDAISRIAEGEADIVVGTQAISHALASGELQVPNLGLVIIDEQHKFGVRQRADLKQAGVNAHYLVMTATPIPRTVALSLFGDLDVSLLRKPPPGRQAIHTYVEDDSRRDQWWDFFRKMLDEGRQGYVVTPLVDDADDSELTSAQQAFEELAAGRLEAYRVDWIHGRMPGREKEMIMEAFRRGESQVLVATSVVEVGVDVPNATLMTIENGERFGLAQLHQLRGRISRGSRQGYLCVFANPDNEDARKRLEAFATTTDGFELAEIDFQLRGPGDMLGVRQHGLPPFRIADLRRDGAVLAEAQSEARRLVGSGEFDSDPWSRLREMVFRRFGNVLDLGDVG